MRYLNLDLKIDAGTGPDYQVTVQAPGGQASAILRFPFTQAELQGQLDKLQIALLRSSGEYRGALSPEERAVQQFGQTLFEALLTGEVSTLYADTQRMAATQETPTGVRLRLAIAPAHLAAVPWEFLCNPTDGSYPCLLPDTSLVRALDQARPVLPLKVTLPLRVLGMIASPSDQPKLEIEKEQDRLRRAFAPLQESGQMELHWVPGQSWEALQDALLYHGPWHIFHFIGHGGVHPESGDGVLAFTSERGTSHLLDADDLATLLAGRRLRLVVLNACEGARGNEHDIFSSTAATLARSGIPGVLAMQYAISDTAAIQLTNKLYSALARGIPLDEAVVAARQAIKLSRNKTLEWGTPVLYLRAQDGILFELQTAASWLAQAQAHYQERLYEEALAAYEQALTLDPNSFQASQGKALTLMALERFEEALPLWERLSERAPSDKGIAVQCDQTRIETNRQAFARAPAGTCLHTCEGHLSYIDSVAWSPNGAHLASASADGTVRLWDATSGRLLQTCQGHTSDVYSVAWSPNGARLASASFDKTVRLWDAASGRLLQTCQGHTWMVWFVCWSPNGARLASVSADKTVRLWDATSGRLLQTCQGHTSDVYSVAWSPNGARLASASTDKTVRLWDGTSGVLLHICQGHTDIVFEVAWSPDGRRLASAGDDGTVRLWDGTSGGLLHTCQGHTSGVTKIAWSPDGKRLASSSKDGTVRLWDAASGRLLHTCAGQGAVAWSPDGRRLASIGDEGIVQLWDGTSGRLLHTCQGHTKEVYSVAWSPDGRRLASASFDKTVRIWKA